MKTIKVKNCGEIPKGFTGIVEFLDGDKWWYKEDKFHREDGPAIEQADGHKEWWINGELHREDGPAVEYQSGAKEWYLEGKDYSEKELNEKLKNSKKTTKPVVKKAAVVTKLLKLRWEKPVPKDFTGMIERPNKIIYWYKDGIQHREDGPAVEYSNGDEEWWFEGKYHRLDGPAIEWVDGTKYWYKEGKLHRDNGPAVECSNGDKEWYLEGKDYSEKDFNEKLKKSKKTTKPVVKKTVVKKPAAKKAAVVTNSDGTKYWYLDGKKYTEKAFNEKFKKSKKTTKPAAKKTTTVQVLKLDENASIPENYTGIIERPDKTKYWYKNGLQHREDGPAVESQIGTKYWYKEGKLHREDGPAIEYSDGTKYWYLDGKRYTEKDFNEKLKKSKKITKTVAKKTATVQVLKLDENALIPKNHTGIVEFSNGTKYWLKEGKLHRDNGPACELADGTKEWFKDGKRHREDGPASEHSDGSKLWYLDGKKYTEKDFNENLKAIKVKTASEIPDGFTGIAFFTDGSKGWLKDGKYHREDGPAIEYPDGTKHWFKDGYPHREDGPAVEYEDGRKGWWYKGLCYSQEEHSSLMKQVNKTLQTETSKQKVLQVVVSDSKEVALRVAVQKINLISKSILLKLFQKTKYTKMEDVLNSEIGKAMLKAITSALLEILKSKFDDKYKLVLEEISKEFRIQAETDLSIEVFAKIEEYLQSSPTMSFIQTRISVENFNNEQNENDNNQEAETAVLVSSYNGMLN